MFLVIDENMRLCLCMMFPNLNSIFALPTLIATFASSGLQAGAVEQGRILKQGLYHDKRPQ